MATTDTRSGFRLPWSSDRSHDDQHEEPAEAAGTTAEDVAPASDGSEAVADGTWPEVDVTSRLGTVTQPSDPAAQADVPTSAEEPQVMVDTVNAPAPAATSAPRKPSRLIAELAAAMRATAETAREQALAQVEADANQVVESIRARSTEGVAELRHRSDEDIAGIREWSKAEIARIREETDHRVSERKSRLETEIAAHGAAIERRVDEVQGTVAAYEADMAEFFERLLKENDPTRLATMAESMPEPPSLVAWTDLDDLAVEAAAPTADTQPVIEAATGTAEQADDTTVEPAAEQADDTTVEPGADAADDATGSATGAWASADSGWAPVATAVDTQPDTAREAQTSWPTGEAAEDAADDWGAPRRTATAEAGAESPDRDAIMAALEAAAEAVGAAEAAASADQVELDPDLFVDRVDEQEETPYELTADPEAEAAIAARLDAFGGMPEPTLADRLASFQPAAAAVDGEPTSTQVVVTGLVSVASIASFKRHLGRLAGVHAVSVASGPDGEFVFSVNHRPDVSFRDIVPTLPGFAARVTGGDEGVVNVTARDPETEG